MTLTSFELYTLLSFCKLGTAAWFVMVFTALATLFLVLFYALESTSPFSKNEAEQASMAKMKSLAKYSSIICACSTILTCIIPSKTEMAAIVVLPAIVNSEAVQTIPNELTALATEWLKELHPKKSE